MGRGSCAGCGMQGHYQTTCPVNPREDPRALRRRLGLVAPGEPLGYAPLPKDAPTVVKVARVRELLAEASTLIDELRGGEPARRFRVWCQWWDKLAAARAARAAARTSWRYLRRAGITLENATAYPTEEIGELVHFVFADRARPKRVQVSYFTKRDGDVYGLTSPAGGTVRAKLLVGWPADHHDPDLGRHGPRYTTYDWREELLVTLAHEAIHVADPAASELEAERHAVRELRRYRLEHPLRALWVRLRPW